MATNITAAALGAPLSFRQALVVAATLLLGALVGMAALTTAALTGGDRLLDRLSRSQDQLARVGSLDADINAWLLSAYEGGAAEQAAAAEQVDAEVRAYLATIAEERAVIGSEEAALAHQDEEARQGEELAAVVAKLRADTEAGEAPPAADGHLMERRRLRYLAAQIEQRERAEAADALARMQNLKTKTTYTGAGILALTAILCLGGVATMSARIGRPLRCLEEAADRVGRGEPSIAPLPLRGFTEVRHVADAFNRLEDELGVQRTVVARHAEHLEAQVAERTADLAASNARLADIDRTRRLFFSKVSHELRTPATVIRAEAEVALRKPDAAAEDLREALEHVVANSAFLQRRLDDLLALARAEDGRIVLQREPVRLRQLLADVAALAEPYTRSSGMRLIGEVGGGGVDGPTVIGDASWLQQALLALVDNAAKFAPGSPALRLSLFTEGGTATIRVADGGPGVAAEALPLLFDSFYQGPGAAGAGGAGLGLSVTRWVVEQHGGKVSARNVEGRGLLIELKLPVAT
jgi:signal transduction histidine kinase